MDRHIDPAMASSVQGESSSSSYTFNSTPKWKYDVFLSFAGKDTRLNFTDHLYAALSRGGIRAFRDNEGIERGEVISQQLLQAIKDSLSAIVVLSKNYANSKWCLHELQKIMECRNELGQQVFPIFYDVDPCDIRYHKKSFGEALTKHEEREHRDKVQNWRKALFEVSNLSGWDTRGRHETEVIQNIVEAIWRTICSKLPSYNDDLVGIASRMFEMNLLLEKDLDGVHFVGIWGIGGIGKTTLARVVYEKISTEFEMSCFLVNVRETSKREGQVQLQKKILSRLNVSNMEIEDEYKGRQIIRNLFCNKKVLLVLDDVNHASQLDNLANPKWFGGGSRVIITTRDMHLLKSHGVRVIYDVQTMKKDESLQIFSRKAFRKDHPEEDYLVYSKSVVEYASGLPLALQVLGSFLYGRSVLEWEDALHKLKKIPNDDIIEVHKISYDALNDEEKSIFLDIASFFKGWRKDEVTRILKMCDHHSLIGISILIEKTLLVERHDKFKGCLLDMHDLIQEMGRSIIYQESPCYRSRLWDIEDINEVLRNNMGTEAIQGIVCNSNAIKSKKIVAEWDPQAFGKMSNLRLLILPSGLELPNGLKCLSKALKVVRWKGCPLEALPLEIPLDNLVDIQMRLSKIKQLWNGIQFMNELKFIDLTGSQDLTETPNFSGVPNLETLILEGCSSLKVVHPSFGQLKKLVEVNLIFCRRLKILPRKLEMDSLTSLYLIGCSEVSVLPEFGESMKELSVLDVSYTAITNLPKSLGCLTGLRHLKLRGCKNLACLPSIFHKLMRDFIIEMTPFIARLSNHQERNVSTWSLRHIFGINLTSIAELELSYCGIRDGSIPDDFGSLSSLLALDLSGNNFVFLPTGCISNMLRLRYLFLNFCHRLKSLPKLPPRLIRLQASGCDSMEPLSDEQLWNLVSSLDHEYRHRIKYANTQLKHTAYSEYIPQRDFFAIIPGREIPSWFLNTTNNHVGGTNASTGVEIPQNFHTSEWSGIAICLHLRKVSPWRSFFCSHSIWWSSKALEDDHYIRKKWAHLIGDDELKTGSFLCVMLLHLNDKTCWQYLRGHNCLFIQFSTCDRGLEMQSLGWHLLRKEEMEEWCNPNYFNKLAQVEDPSAEVWLPDSILDRTICREER